MTRLELVGKRGESLIFHSNGWPRLANDVDGPDQFGPIGEAVLAGEDALRCLQGERLSQDGRL